MSERKQDWSDPEYRALVRNVAETVIGICADAGMTIAEASHALRFAYREVEVQGYRTPLVKSKLLPIKDDNPRLKSSQPAVNSSFEVPDKSTTNSISDPVQKEDQQN